MLWLALQGRVDGDRDLLHSCRLVCVYVCVVERVVWRGRNDHKISLPYIFFTPPVTYREDVKMPPLGGDSQNGPLTTPLINQ